MSETQQTIVHATSVALDAVDGAETGLAGVLLRGGSGYGKSDLALRLIDGGATLVADDRTVLRRLGDDILLASPDPIRGRLEVRGLGIVPVGHVSNVRLLIVIDLVDAGAVERLPPARSELVLGLPVPAIAIAPFESSAPAKVRLAVRAAACGILHRLD